MSTKSLAAQVVDDYEGDPLRIASALLAERARGNLLKSQNERLRRTCTAVLDILIEQIDVNA